MLLECVMLNHNSLLASLSPCLALRGVNVGWVRLKFALVLQSWVVEQLTTYWMRSHAFVALSILQYVSNLYSRLTSVRVTASVLIQSSLFTFHSLTFYLASFLRQLFQRTSILALKIMRWVGFQYILQFSVYHVGKQYSIHIWSFLNLVRRFCAIPPPKNLISHIDNTIQCKTKIYSDLRSPSVHSHSLATHTFICISNPRVSICCLHAGNCSFMITSSRPCNQYWHSECIQKWSPESHEMEICNWTQGLNMPSSGLSLWVNKESWPGSEKREEEEMNIAQHLHPNNWDGRETYPRN